MKKMWIARPAVTCFVSRSKFQDSEIVTSMKPNASAAIVRNLQRSATSLAIAKIMRRREKAEVAIVMADVAAAAMGADRRFPATDRRIIGHSV